jgi:hypothetical protein
MNIASWLPSIQLRISRDASDGAIEQRQASIHLTHSRTVPFAPAFKTAPRKSITATLVRRDITMAGG